MIRPDTLPPGTSQTKGMSGWDSSPPSRNSRGLPLSEADKNFNRAIDQIRWRIEQVIANLKTWHTLKTGYRRPTDTLPDTITATLGIIFTYTL